MRFTQFTTFFIVLTGVSIILLLIYFFLIGSDIIPAATYSTSIFAIQYLLTLFVFFIVLRASYRQPEYFVKITILSVVLRLIIYGVFNYAMIYLLNGKGHLEVILFFVIYMVFTILEIGMLYRVINTRTTA